VDPGTLAVPHAEDAVVFRLRKHRYLLRAPDRRRREVFVDAGLELDVVAIQVLLRAPKRLVQAAERRAAIPGDEARGVEPALWSRVRCSISSRMSAWVPVRNTRPRSTVYLSSRLNCARLVGAFMRQGPRRHPLWR